MECDTQSDSDDNKSSEPLSHRLKLRAADPRYITKSEDCNRGDIILTKDVKEGKVNDRYLAPAISRYAADMRMKVGTGADTDRQTKDVKEKVEDLHQRWGRANVTPNSEDIKAQADNEAKVTNRSFNGRISHGKEIPSRGQRMIPSTSQTAMLRLRLYNFPSFMSRFQER